MLPTDGGVQPIGHRTMVIVRSNDSNSEQQLVRHLAAFNWSQLYNMTSVEYMATYFYDVTTSLLECYLPLRSVKRSADKPWITDEFKRLIRPRQHAWTHHNTAEYKRHCNAVNRLSQKL